MSKNIWLEIGKLFDPKDSQQVDPPKPPKADPPKQGKGKAKKK